MESKEESLELRKYQELILSQAKTRNTIAFLPTGAGKTLIACHVIQSRIENLRIQRESRSENEWAKVIVFIAPQKVLLHQQIEYVKLHASPIMAAEFYGEKVKNYKLIDNWTADEWKPEIEANEVLGMTPAVLLRILQDRVIPPNIIDMIVFDECHNAVGNHPMAALCDIVQTTPDCSPLILGLTASPINNKKKSLSECIVQLEQRLNAEFFYPTEEFLMELHRSLRKPKMLIIDHGFPLPSTTSYFQEIIGDFETIVKICQVYEEGKINLTTFQHDVEGKNPFYEKILASLRIAVGKSFRPQLDNKFPFVKRILFQTIDITKEGGIYLGLSSLSLSLQLQDEEIQRKELFKNSLIQTILQGLGLGDSMEISNFSDEFDNNTFENRRSVSQTVKSIDTTVLQMRVDEIILYLSGSVTKFISLLDQAYSSFKGFCELIYYFAMQLGKMNCDRAIQRITEKMESESKWSSRRERIDFFISLIRAASEQQTFDYSANIHKELYKGNYFHDIILICDQLLETISFDGVIQKFLPIPIKDGTIFPFNYNHFSHKVEALLNIFIGVLQASNAGTRHYLTKEVSLKGATSFNERAINTPEEFQTEIQNAIQPLSTPASPQPSTPSSSLKIHSTNNDRTATSASIVFCNMRIMALVLNKFFQQVASCWNEIIPKVLSGSLTLSPTFPFLSDTILGTDTSAKQRITLQKLRNQKINLLFATDVAQEGLDIPQCNMIINWNNPKTLVGFIQRRGRARSQQSLLISFFKSILEKSKENYELKDFYNFLLEEYKTNDILQEFMKLFEKPMTTKASSDCSYTIPSTEASIDSIRAKILLNEYCGYIALQLSKAFENGDLADVSYFDVNSVKFCYPLVLFHEKLCQLFLPETISIRLRRRNPGTSITIPEFKSPINTKKKEAEGIVHLQVIKFLHEMKEIDDHFHFREPFVVFPTDISSSSISTSTSQKSAATSPSDQMKIIQIKSIPDRLKDSNNKYKAFNAHEKISSEELQEGRMISFYSIEITPKIDYFSKFDSKISSQFHTLQSIILGFPSKLSDQILNTDFPIHLESIGFNKISFRLKYIGDRTLSHMEFMNLLSFMSFIGDLVSFEVPCLPPNEFITKQQSKEAYENCFLQRESISTLQQELHQPLFIFPYEGLIQKNVQEIPSDHFFDLAIEGLRFIHNMKVIQFRNLNQSLPKFIHFQQEITASSSMQMMMTKEIVTPNGKMFYCFEQFVHNQQNDPLPFSQWTKRRLADIMDGSKNITFYDYYQKQYGKRHVPFQQYLDMQLSQEKESEKYYCLSKAHNLTGVFTFTNLFHQFNEQEYQQRLLSSQQSKNSVVDLMPTLCFPLGLLSIYQFSLLVPSFIHRLQSIFLAEELLMKYFPIDLMSQDGKLIDILAAMTPRRKEENLNSERLEFIGDAFLKYATTLLVFFSSPKDNEAKLTSSRMKLISNRYLAGQSLTVSNVHEYLRIIPLGKEINHPATLNVPSRKMTSASKKTNNFISATSSPHSAKLHSVPSPTTSLRNVNVYLGPNQGPAASSEDGTAMMMDEIQEGYEEVEVHEKTIADMVESLLGVAIHPPRSPPSATFSASSSEHSYQIGDHGEKEGFTLLHRLAIIQTEDLSYLLNKNESIIGYLTHLQTINPRPQLSMTTISTFEGDYLHYSFHHKDLLSLTLTHPTLSSVWNYQRLEFLGDSILDYLVGLYLFSISRNDDAVEEEWDEGILSKLKTFFTNNEVLAEIACNHFQLFQFLQHDHSMHLAQQVTDERNRFHQRQQQGLEEVQNSEDIEQVDLTPAERQKIDIFTIINDYLDRNPAVLTTGNEKNKEVDNNDDQILSTPMKGEESAKTTPLSPSSSTKVSSNPPSPSLSPSSPSKRKIFADMLEALIGAIYLDSGGELKVIAHFLEEIGFFHVTKEQLTTLIGRFSLSVK